MTEEKLHNTTPQKDNSSFNTNEEWTPVSNSNSSSSLLDKCRKRMVELAIFTAGLFSSSSSLGAVPSSAPSPKDEEATAETASLAETKHASLDIKRFNINDVLGERLNSGLLDIETLGLSSKYFKTSNLLRKLTVIAQKNAKGFKGGCAAAVRNAVNACRCGKVQLLEEKIYATPQNPENGRRSAFLLGDALYKTNDFYKIPVTSIDDLENSPDGTIIVYLPQDRVKRKSNKDISIDGHIEFKYRKEAISDGIQSLSSAWEKTGEGKRYKSAYMLIHKSALNTELLCQELGKLPPQMAVEMLYSDRNIPADIQMSLKREQNLQLIPQDFKLADLNISRKNSLHKLNNLPKNLLDIRKNKDYRD